MKQLCVEHKQILHIGDGAKQKKYFEMAIEELISAIAKKLPAKELGAFVIFSGYLDRMGFNDAEHKARELMFFVLQSIGTDDYSLFADTKTKCEVIVDDFISRFKKDSIEGHEIWDQAFNAPKDIAIIPYELKAGTSTYVGWQVAISFEVYPDLCYKPDNWLP